MTICACCPALPPRPVVYENMAALTGIERVIYQSGSARLGLSHTNYAQLVYQEPHRYHI